MPVLRTASELIGVLSFEWWPLLEFIATSFALLCSHIRIVSFGPALDLWQYE
jgi:hypothetical protein